MQPLGAPERPLITLVVPSAFRPPAGGDPRPHRPHPASRRGRHRSGRRADTPFPEGWPKAARTRIAPLLADYDGRATPLPWNRNPDPRRLAGAA